MGPFRRLACFTALWALAACATPERAERPRPPSLEGEGQAIGRIFDIDVRGGEGATIRLRGVSGRVTVVCILGDEGNTSEQQAPLGEAAATESDAAAEREDASAPGADTDATEFDAAAEREDASAPAAGAETAGAAADLATSCADLANRWKDRITVVGLALDASRNLRQIPFRTYRDTGGKALEESLNLDPTSQILLVDVQGRIARWFPPGSDEALEREVERLAY